MVKFSKQVSRVICAESISVGELATMIDRAAITSAYRGFNRRYNHWLFLVKYRYVERMALADALQEVSKSESYTIKTHDLCQGFGCKDCGWIGEVIRHI